MSTYDKLMVAECLPNELRRVIWLDCDMLVLADLAELWETPLGDGHLLAVRDALVPTLSSRFGVSDFAKIGLDASAPYFNAGMMVIDLAKWRDGKVAERAIEYLRRFHHRVFFWDQEALNVVLANRWTSVDERWNWSANLGRLSSNGDSGNGHEQGRIVHFNGNLKPWVVREATKLDAVYFETLDRTAWRGWRPKRTLARSIVGWYGSSFVRRILYPAEQVGMRMVWRLTHRKA